MQIQIQKNRLYCRVRIVKITSQLHPSRSYKFTHRLREDGNLMESNHLKGIKQGLTDVLKLVRPLRNVDIQILRRNENQSNYSKYLILIVTQGPDDAFKELQHMLNGLDLISYELDSQQLSTALFHKNGKVYVDSDNLSPDIFTKYGFELSSHEFQTILNIIYKSNFTLKLPIIDNGKIFLGRDILGKEIRIDAIGNCLLQNPRYLEALTTNAIILTDNPSIYGVDLIDRYLKFEQDGFIQRTFHNNEEVFETEQEFGINLLQTYTSYPSILMTILESISLLTQDKRLLTEFISILDEIYTSSPTEEFIGMNIQNMFIDDEFNSYQTISNQEGKFKLLTYFSQYLDHSTFNKTSLDILKRSGRVLFDLSLLDENQKIMVEILVRALKRENVIRGAIVSDIFNSLTQSKKFDKYSIINLNTLCEDYIEINPTPSVKDLQGVEYDTMILESDYIAAMNLSKADISKINIGYFWPFLHDEVLLISRGLITLVDPSSLLSYSAKIQQSLAYHHKLIQSIPLSDEDSSYSEYVVEILSKFKLVYREDMEEDEELLDIEYEEEIDEISDENYLSHYFIVSIAREMLEYKEYTSDEIELALLSEVVLEYYLDLMSDRGYLDIKPAGYLLNAKARTYVSSIRKVIDSHEIDPTIEEDLRKSSFQFINHNILEVLKECKTENYHRALTLLLDMKEAFADLAEKIELPGLVSHYYGLIASLQYKLAHPNSPESLQNYIKDVNIIIDNRAKEFDIHELLRFKMQEVLMDQELEDDTGIDFVGIVDQVVQEHKKDRQEALENEEMNDQPTSAGNSDVVDDLVQKAISTTSTNKEKLAFLPPEYPEIGSWIVTDRFISVMDQTTTNEVQISAVDAFVHQVLYHQDISHFASAEIILKRLDFSIKETEEIFDRLRRANILDDTSGKANFSFSLVQPKNYPSIPMYPANLELQTQINILQQVNERSLKSQTLLQQLLNIFESHKLVTEQYLVHSLMIERDQYLIKQILRVVNELSDFLTAKLPEVPQDKKTDQISSIPPPKLKTKKLVKEKQSEGMLLNLPKPKVKDNSTIDTSYLKEPVSNVESNGDTTKSNPIKNSESSKDQKSNSNSPSELKYTLPEKVHSNLGREYIETFLEDISQLQREAPDKILRAAIIHLFNHKIGKHPITDNTTFSDIIELLDNLSNATESNFIFLTNSFSDIHSIYELNPNESGAISEQYFKRINQGIIYFDFDPSIADQIENFSNS